MDYRGVPLLQCGRYILDGELRIRPADQSAAKVKYVMSFPSYLCTHSFSLQSQVGFSFR